MYVIMLHSNGIKLQCEAGCGWNIAKLTFKFQYLIYIIMWNVSKCEQLEKVNCQRMWIVSKCEVSEDVNCQIIWTVKECELSVYVNFQMWTVSIYGVSDQNCQYIWTVGCEMSVYMDCQMRTVSIWTFRCELSVYMDFQMFKMKRCMAKQLNLERKLILLSTRTKCIKINK